MANVPSMMDSWNLATSGLEYKQGPLSGKQDAFTPAQGGYPTGGFGAYGGIPTLPKSTTDTTTTTGADLWGQLKAAGGAGIGQNLTQGVGVIGSNLQGVVNPDVKAGLASTAAGIGAGGMGMGPGAPGSDIAYLKLLGNTSQGLQNLGLQQQNQLFSAFPYQQGSTTTTTTDLSALQSIFNAMPDPYLSAMESLRAIGAGMGGGGGGGGLNMPLAWNQKPTDMSWFYQKPGGGAATPAAPTPTQGGTGLASGDYGMFDESGINWADPTTWGTPLPGDTGFGDNSYFTNDQIDQSIFGLEPWD